MISICRKVKMSSYFLMKWNLIRRWWVTPNGSLSSPLETIKNVWDGQLIPISFWWPFTEIITFHQVQCSEDLKRPALNQGHPPRPTSQTDSRSDSRTLMGFCWEPLEVEMDSFFSFLSLVQLQSVRVNKWNGKIKTMKTATGFILLLPNTPWLHHH